VRAGHCWRLFSEEFFLSPRMDEHPLPEIQRVPLEEVVLQVRACARWFSACVEGMLRSYVT
jgi:HrpA-like RNA helicase